mgnify:CR=1 FL=1
MSSLEMREKVIHWFNSGQTHKLSAPFQSGDNYINLNLLNKLTEKTKEIEKFWGFIFPKCIKKDWREMVWACNKTSLDFFAFLAATCYYTKVHINSLGIKRPIRCCILYFEIAPQDAKSWRICESCHQSRISLRAFWQIC